MKTRPEHPKPPAKPARRAFLKGLAATALAGLGASSAATAGAPAALRLGVLLPRGQGARGDGESFLRGLRLGLEDAAAAGVRAELLTEEVAAGAQAAAAGAELLLRGGRADLLVGLLGSAALPELGALLARYRRPLLAVHAGADTVRPEERSRWIVHHTLRQWQRSFAAGVLAARQGATPASGGRAVVLASLFASGFDHLYAFEAGLHSAGGELLEVIVTDRTPGEHDLVGALATVQRLAPDVVYLLHDDQAVDLLARELAALPQPPLRLAADAAVTGRRLAVQGASAAGTLNLAAWSPELPHPENAAFLAAWAATRREAPSGAALLGYEAALLLAAAGPNGLLEVLHSGTVVGPRGRLTLEPGTQVTVAPAYWQEVRLGAGSRPRLALRHDLNAAAQVAAGVNEAQPQLAALHSAPRSGWTDVPALT